MTANMAGANDPSGLLTVGKTAFTAVLFTVTMEICIVSRYWTALFVIAVIGSVGLWFPILIAVPRVYPYPEMAGLADALFPSPIFWLTVVICTVGAFVYRTAVICLQRHFTPTDLDIMEEAEKNLARNGAQHANCLTARAPAAAAALLVVRRAVIEIMSSAMCCAHRRSGRRCCRGGEVTPCRRWRRPRHHPAALGLAARLHPAAAA